MGPKIENVGFSSVLPILFEGSKAAGARQENEQPSGPRPIPAPFEVQRVRFLIKNALRLY